jgi:hypothetical protein
MYIHVDFLASDRIEYVIISLIFFCEIINWTILYQLYFRSFRLEMNTNVSRIWIGLDLKYVKTWITRFCSIGSYFRQELSACIFRIFDLAEALIEIYTTFFGKINWKTFFSNNFDFKLLIYWSIEYLFAMGINDNMLKSINLHEFVVAFI